MEKILFFVIMLTVFGLSGKAQNTLYANVDETLCLDEFTVTFTDQSSETFYLGCTGSYEFNIGDHEIEFITINGTQCQMGYTTDVTVNNGTPAQASVTPRKQTNIDGVINLLR